MYAYVGVDLTQSEYVNLIRINAFIRIRLSYSNNTILFGLFAE